MEAFLKKSIKVVIYGSVATTAAFFGLLIAQKKATDYSSLIAPVSEVHADAPALQGDGVVSDGGGGGDSNGGDDDDDDDDS